MERVNSGRQISIDVAKALSIIFMVFVHIHERFGNGYADSSFYGRLVEALGGAPSAVIFMFAMGIGIVYSKHSTFQTMIKRGFSLFGLAYVLNFFRGSVPSLIDYFIYHDKGSLYDALYDFVEVDILQFAGLAMVFLAFITKKPLSLSKIGLTGLSISIFNTILMPFVLTYKEPVENPYLVLIFKGITGVFFGQTGDFEEVAAFPFFTWIIYPLAGYCFGLFLIKESFPKLLYKKISKIFIPVWGTLLVGLWVMYYFGFYFISAYSYYYHNMYMNLLYTSFAFVWVCFIYGITKFIPKKLTKTMITCSKNITIIYVVHWIILGALSIFISPKSFNNFVFTIVSIFVLITSYWISIAVVKLRKK